MLQLSNFFCLADDFRLASSHRVIREYGVHVFFTCYITTIVVSMISSTEYIIRIYVLYKYIVSIHMDILNKVPLVHVHIHVQQTTNVSYILRMYVHVQVHTKYG